MSYNQQIEESDFCKRLVPMGRILEEPDYNVWCCSPIDGPDGKVHVFYSRWLNKYGHWGWISHCEIAHAVADSPEGPYETVDVALDGTGGDNWDAMTIHNPSVYKVGDKYVLLYIGNLKPDVETTSIGMAFADSLYGPWERSAANPVVVCGEEGEWDDVTADNPAFIQHPDGRFFIYYRAWSGRGIWQQPGVRNDKLGLAIADKLEGPYIKHPENPIMDLTKITDKRPVGFEDPCVFLEDGIFKFITRDYGFLTNRGGKTPNGGLYFESKDGIHMDLGPQLAYHKAEHYFELDEAEKQLERFGRFERPQILMRNGRAAYLFTAIRGGRYQTSSAYVHKIL